MESEAPQIDYLLHDDYGKDCDDNQRLICVRKSLFMGLCLNAHQDEGRSKKDFNELLRRVKANVIDSSKNEITLTQKEMHAGLIRHVKYANNRWESSNGPILEVIICGQKTWMAFDPNVYKPNNFSAQNYDPYETTKMKKLTSDFEAVLNQLRTAEDDNS